MNTTDDKPPESLTSTKRLSLNTAYNLAGQVLPLVVGLASIPFIIQGLGIERFGLLTITWMVLGYFNLFDFGLGRALTKFVADRTHCDDRTETSAIVWTSLGLMTILGGVGCLALLIGSEFLANAILRVPAHLQDEAVSSLRLLALAIPLSILTTGLRGVLEAYQRFGASNAIRIPLGLTTYLAPLAVLTVTESLVPIIAVLLLARFIALIAHFAFCFRVLPEMQKPTIARAFIPSLISFGSWVTVSNLLSPILATVDRFIISNSQALNSVSYYTTPYEVVAKIPVVGGALVSVLFPAFAATFITNPQETETLFWKGVKITYLALYPITFLIVTFSNEFMYLWLGTNFSTNSTQVMQWLAIGMLASSIAQVYFALLQGVGRPGVVAILLALETAPYLLALTWATRTHGIYGTAVAWTLRIAIELAIIHYYSRLRILPSSRINAPTKLFLAASAAALTVPIVMDPLSYRITFAALWITVFATFSWHRILDKQEQKMIRRVASL